MERCCRPHPTRRPYVKHTLIFCYIIKIKSLLYILIVGYVTRTLSFIATNETFVSV
jgi:hypothetical protein